MVATISLTAAMNRYFDGECVHWYETDKGSNLWWLGALEMYVSDIMTEVTQKPIDILWYSPEQAEEFVFLPIKNKLVDWNPMAQHYRFLLGVAALHYKTTHEAAALTNNGNTVDTNIADLQFRNAMQLTRLAADYLTTSIRHFDDTWTRAIYLKTRR